MLRTTRLDEGWEFAQGEWLSEQKFGYTRTPGWLPAIVPGYVHLDLVANGIIRHPFEEMAELGCQWVDEADWSYRTRFSWQPDPSNPRRVLVFEGLDTVCVVSLNGAEIARHDNMFLPLEVDVTDLLREGENEIRVDFSSAVRVGRERRAAYFAKNGIADNVANFEERAFVRKAQFMFGWDWGPRLVSCGIWKPVKLIEFEARLTDVSISRTGSSVAVHSTIEGRGSVTAISHAFDSDWEHPAEDCPLELVDKIDNRWWTNDKHDQVYKVLTSAILGGKGPLLDWPQDMLDKRSTPFGLVDIELVREKDEFGESFKFRVNGKPLWAMGANWIPIHSFPSYGIQAPPLEGRLGGVTACLPTQSDDVESKLGAMRAPPPNLPLKGEEPELRFYAKVDLRKLLESCQSMNFNMIRVWGGGLYESDEFYDLCDELGILVWQDFPFACSYCPDDDDFVEKIREEATYHVKRLRHHPCLALWCGNNENLTMWEGKWGGADRQPSRFHGERIWNEVLKQVVEEHDPGRPYIPTSPIGSPPGKEDCNAGGYGDSHYWDVWHGRGDWIHYSDSTARFSSEFGFPSSCGRRAWNRVLSPPLKEGQGVVEQLLPSSENGDDLPTGRPRPPIPNPSLKGREPQEAVIRWHDKTGRPFEYLRDLITKHYPEPKNLEEWIYFSQLNQRDAMRHAIEHYRRSEFCKGTLIWQMNDCWPVQSWSLVDGEGDWKASAFELRRLYSTGLSSYERVGNVVRLWYINDDDEPFPIEGLDAVGIFDSISGEKILIDHLAKDIILAPGERRVVYEFDVKKLDASRSILWTALGGDPVHILCEPKKLQLSKPVIKVFIQDDEVEVLPSAPALDVFLWDETGGATFTNNFLDFEMVCPWTYSYRGQIGKLRARSWVGEHEIESCDGPLWPRRGPEEFEKTKQG